MPLSWDETLAFAKRLRAVAEDMECGAAAPGALYLLVLDAKGAVIDHAGRFEMALGDKLAEKLMQASLGPSEAAHEYRKAVRAKAKEKA